jgi:hypothetical protein
MSYKIRTQPTVACRTSVPLHEVPDGQWVVEDIYFERHMVPGVRQCANLDPRVIISNNRKVVFYETNSSSYANAGGGQSRTWFSTAACTHPFAVVSCHAVGADHVFASIMTARQIHKGELGRYPTLPGMPEVVCQRIGTDGKAQKFVRWSEVAAAYGETDLRRLWTMFMPFCGRDLCVTYMEAENIGRVYYAQRYDGRPLDYYSDEFRTLFTDERVEEIARRQPDSDKADALRRRMQEDSRRLLCEHEEHVKKIRLRRWVIDSILWDDPVLQLEHLFVPVAFARSVLTCKRFGYIPDFRQQMEAKAREDARAAAS